MRQKNQTIGARLRLVLGPGIALGPGKIELLEGIKETGSISAAGRRMEMSYRRAWLLVDELNGYFSEPVVAAMKGGAEGGGATLTALGEDVLARYRHMEEKTASAIATDFKALRRRTSGTDQSTKRRPRPRKSAKRK